MNTNLTEAQMGSNQEAGRLPRSTGILVDDDMNVLPIGFGRAISLAKLAMPDGLAGKVELYERGQVTLTCAEEDMIRALAQTCVSRELASAAA